MNDLEATRYKRELIQKEIGKDEISQAQAIELMYHSARTRGEIDAAVEEYRRRHAEAKAGERARLQETQGGTQSIEEILENFRKGQLKTQ